MTPYLNKPQLSAFCSAFMAVSLTVLLLAACVAQAGTLTYVTCEGTASAAGWSAYSADAPAGAFVNPTCSASWPQVAGEELGVFPAAMEAALPAGTSPSARAGLLFSIPGDSIVGGDIWVNSQTASLPSNYSGDRGVQLSSGTPENEFWKKVRGSGLVTIPAGITSLFASAVCEGKPCEAVNLYVMGAHIMLSPVTLPSVSSIGGSLSTGGTVHGTQMASFTASDTGPGVYQVTASIDGTVIYHGTPNPDGGACAPVGIYKGTSEFLTPQPCPTSVPISLPVQTGTLPDGIHALMITATDAAGDVSQASELLFRSENQILAAGAGRVPRGLGPSELPSYLLQLDEASALLQRGVHHDYATSALKVSGLLRTPQGVPAPGVAVHLLAATKGGTRLLSSAITDAMGQWSLQAPRGATRTLRVAYGQASAATTHGAQVTKETVSPDVSLRVSDRRGGRLRFTGRIAISPLGNPRPLIGIQASTDAIHWQGVGLQARVNAHGVFHLTYTSPASIGGHFALQAVTPATSEWQQGVSSRYWLTVR
jgi:hypothetical protein